MTSKHILLSLLLFLVFSKVNSQEQQRPYIVVLGIAQDGGYPHAGCERDCCKKYYTGKEPRHFVSCLALVDPVSKQRWIFDCTPDFTFQLHLLDSLYPAKGRLIDGIFLTHAHIGHYTGLMYLGKEAMDTRGVPVYGMPDMMNYLSNNGPWSQLVKLKNITLDSMIADKQICIAEHIFVTPFYVPHRDEYTKTVGYKIAVNGSNIIFIPDIDKWQKWDRDIVKLVKENDLLFLDGTFYMNGEIVGRDMKEIPHPFIYESMELFKDLSAKDKAKIHFIHLNHTNSALINDSESRKEIEKKGFHVANETEKYFF